MNYCSSSLAVDHEFEKLLLRMNPPRVTVDNASDKKATLIKVDSANKRGSLLEVVQVLSDLNFFIRRAYISSDGGWFMDVFHVTDENGNKVHDRNISHLIKQSLDRSRGCSSRFERSSSVVGSSSLHKTTIGSCLHTTIELSGQDRPGLLSEVFAVLSGGLNCNVVAAEAWSHNSRMASIVYITDQTTGSPIDDDPGRLADIKRLLLYVLVGRRDDTQTANTAVSVGSTHTERRLHQIMYADRDFDVNQSTTTTKSVTVENCAEKGYTVVSLCCPDRPKLLFDTVCTLTDMQYVVFHGTIVSQGLEAQQEYYIRHTDGCAVSSEAERQRVIDCLEAAIKRRASEGIRLELCGEDRVGLLSDVTRVFRENGLSVTRAEVTTRGGQAVNVFYVTDASGGPVTSEAVEAVRKEIGGFLTLIRVNDDTKYSCDERDDRFSQLATLFRSSSEKILYNLGLINSCS